MIMHSILKYITTTCLLSLISVFAFPSELPDALEKLLIQRKKMNRDMTELFSAPQNNVHALFQCWVQTNAYENKIIEHTHTLTNMLLAKENILKQLKVNRIQSHKELNQQIENIQAQKNRYQFAVLTLFIILLLISTLSLVGLSIKKNVNKSWNKIHNTTLQINSRDQSLQESSKCSRIETELLQVKEALSKERKNRIKLEQELKRVIRILEL